MLEILKVDIKNNKIIFASLLLAISVFTLCLYLGFYEIRFFNDVLEAKKLSSQNTNFLKWIDLIYPLIFTSFIIKIFSDSHSRETIAFSLSLPVSNFKGSLSNSVDEEKSNYQMAQTEMSGPFSIY